VHGGLGDRWTYDVSGRRHTALRTAIARRRPNGTVSVHSDRGGQLRTLRYQPSLCAHGLTASMGRFAPTSDYAAIGASFVLLQKDAPIATPGTHATSSTWQSSPGSDGPSTGVAAGAWSANSLLRVRNRHRLQHARNRRLTRQAPVSRSLHRPSLGIIIDHLECRLRTPDLLMSVRGGVQRVRNAGATRIRLMNLGTPGRALRVATQGLR
jgi:hypothetical protein